MIAIELFYFRLRPVSRQSELVVAAKQGEDNGEQARGRIRAHSLGMFASK
jgi:hypothetical protein